MNGALARANAAIRNARPNRPDARRQRARQALWLADQMLEQLEQLMLRGAMRVPGRVLKMLPRLRRSALRAGIHRPTLRVGIDVPGLMDDVFDLEAQLLRRMRRTTVDRTGRLGVLAG